MIHQEHFEGRGSLANRNEREKEMTDRSSSVRVLRSLYVLMKWERTSAGVYCAWDTCLGFGEKYTTGLQKLNRVIGQHRRERYPCPLCENSEFGTTVMEHV